MGPPEIGRWLDLIRQTTLFLLGVAVTLEAIIRPGANTPTLIAGLVLLGVVPLDRFLTRQPRGG
jgi:hypothetical protein